jgi:hypothetical protein
MLLLLILSGLNSGIHSRTAEPPDADLEWVSTSAMISPRAYHTATLLPSGKVLVAGGYLRPDVLETAELYDPNTGSWTSTGSMNRAREEHSATLLHSGKVLIVGGDPPPPAIPMGELYDPDTGTWTFTGPMIVNHSNGHTATLLPSGKVLVTGGMSADGNQLRTAELYDPDTNSWTLTGSMTAGRYRNKAVLLPTGKVLVIGVGLEVGIVSLGELYNPDLEQWAAISEPIFIWSGFTLTLLPSGKVLAAGGNNDWGYLQHIAELYDPVADSWIYRQMMRVSRAAHTATLLDSGRVLVVGGEDSDAAASAELYDPIAETWTEFAPSGMRHRRAHTATLLYSGRVLIAGGVWENVEHASAELVTAETRTPPAARALQVTTAEDQSVSVELVGLDVDEDSLTFAVVKPPAHGTLSGTAPSLTYTPAADFHGSDAFTYKVSDGTLDSSTVTSWLTVTPVDDPPQAHPLSLATSEGQPLQVVLPDQDRDGDELTFTVVTFPAHGRLFGTAPHLIYHPPKRGFGQDSFTYRVSDGRRQSETATVSISITPGARDSESCSATGSRNSLWVIAPALLGAAFFPRRNHRKHGVPGSEPSSRSA